MEINKKYTMITEGSRRDHGGITDGSRRDHGGIKEGALMIKLLEKLCSIDIQKDVEAALLAFHDAYDRSVVCASLPAVDLPEILHRQPRGWFSPAMVRRKMYENINGFTSNDTFTVLVKFASSPIKDLDPPNLFQWSSSSNNSWRCTRGSSSL